MSKSDERLLEEWEQASEELLQIEDEDEDAER